MNINTILFESNRKQLATTTGLPRKPWYLLVPYQLTAYFLHSAPIQGLKDACKYTIASQSKMQSFLFCIFVLSVLMFYFVPVEYFFKVRLQPRFGNDYNRNVSCNGTNILLATTTTFNPLTRLSLLPFLKTILCHVGMVAPCFINCFRGRKNPNAYV